MRRICHPRWLSVGIGCSLAILLALGILGVALPAGAQAPGVDISPAVEIYDGPGAQQAPQVAFDTVHNRFLVAWCSWLPDGIFVYGQLVNADGTLDGGTIAIATEPGAQHITNGDPSTTIAFDPESQRFLVTWSDNRRGIWNVYGQLITAEGALFGGNFPISPDPDVLQMWAGPEAVEYDPVQKRFLVAWSGDLSNGWSNRVDVYCQFVGPDGALIGSLIKLTDTQDLPLERPIRVHLAFDADNDRFLVSWIRHWGSKGAFGRLLNADGSVYGEEIMIADPGSGFHDGVYDPVRKRYLEVVQVPHIFQGQFVSADGSPQGASFQITDAYSTSGPSVVFDPVYDKFLVVGNGVNSYGTRFGQFLNADGSRYGTHFTIDPDGDTAPNISFGSGSIGSLVVWTNRGSQVFGKFVKLTPWVDLVVRDVASIQSSVTPGGTLTITDTVMNLGLGSTGNTTSTRYYLSVDDLWQGTDTLLSGSRTVPILGPETGSDGMAAVSIPALTTPGSYYLIACADDTNLVIETDENNNCATAANPILVSRPDLIVSTVTCPTTAAPGQLITVGDTTKNNGVGLAVASTTRFYLSANTAWDTSDTELGSRAVPELTAGAVDTGSVAVTIPAGKPAGTYYVIAKADAPGVIGETNETNNTKYKSLLIGPDLIVSVVTGPTTAAPGQVITVGDTTKNSGGAPAGASTTKYYLSTNATWDVLDTELGSRAVPELTAGAVDTGSVAVTIPAGKPAGTYHVIAKADAPGVIGETSETNNTKYKSLLIGPDLIVSAVTGPTTAAPGQLITVGDTTKNNGVGLAVASTTGFYLSANTTWDTSDTELGSRAVPELTAGAVDAGSVAVTIPAGKPAGTYYVIAKADAPGVIGETSETNNTKYKSLLIGPDLIVSAVTGPTTAAPGQVITVGDTTKNSGGALAGASTTKYYLSTNGTWDALDNELGSRAVPELTAGAVDTGSVAVTIPAGKSAGTYYLIAKADALGVIAETSETNNTRNKSLLIGPDLIVSAVTGPTTAAPEQVITVGDTTKNSGGTPAGASTTKFYLSTNGTWDALDTELGSRAVPELTAGAVDTGSVAVTIPAGKPAGTYYVIAKADAPGVIGETSETNNTKYKSLLIGPDLVISSLTVPSSVELGGTMTVSNTTKNNGGGQAAASTTSLYLSTNSTWDTADKPLGSRPVPLLAAGASDTGGTSVAIPAGTTAGVYYVIAKADSGAAVAEVNEKNNTSTRSITINPFYSDTITFDSYLAHSNSNTNWVHCLPQIPPGAVITSVAVEIKSKVWSWPNPSGSICELVSDSNVFFVDSMHQVSCYSTGTGGTHPLPTNFYLISRQLTDAQIEWLKDDKCLDVELYADIGGTYYLAYSKLIVKTSGQ